MVKKDASGAKSLIMLPTGKTGLAAVLYAILHAVRYAGPCIR